MEQKPTFIPFESEKESISEPITQHPKSVPNDVQQTVESVQQAAGKIAQDAQQTVGQAAEEVQQPSYRQAAHPYNTAPQNARSMPSAQPEKKKGKAGLVIGVVAALLFAAFCLYWFVIRAYQ